jgi:5-(carboxyamino)imidazole ribonucleotide synthase
MFLTMEGTLLVNEIAPRPHNSGHHTAYANDTSQFEQHLRAILNLPLGDTTAHTQAAMVNLLGEPAHQGLVVYEGMEQVLGMAGVHPYLYGKKTTKPFRKMGHVTILEKDFDKMVEKIKHIQKTIKIRT